MKSQFGYCLRAGISSVSKHKAMSAAAIAITVACLMLVSALFAFGRNVQWNLSRFQTDNAILAFVDDSYTEEEAMGLQGVLEHIDGVKSVTFITRQEAYNSYMALYSQKDSSYLEPTVFRDRYSIQTDGGAAEEVAKKLGEMPGIADVRLDETITKGFHEVEQVVRIIGVALTALLLGISIFIMSNTIKLTTISRSEEIAVEKMMGANDWFVRMPFIMEGCVVGLIGAAVSFVFTSIFYLIICGLIGSTGILSLIDILSLADIAPMNLLLCMAIGLGIGIVGSLITIRKYLNV